VSSLESPRQSVDVECMWGAEMAEKLVELESSNTPTLAYTLASGPLICSDHMEAVRNWEETRDETLRAAAEEHARLVASLEGQQADRMAEAREKHAAAVQSVRQYNSELRERQGEAAAEIERALAVWRGKTKAYGVRTQKLLAEFMAVEVPSVAAANAEHMAALLAAFEAALQVGCTGARLRVGTRR
jgi:hypothetical protein